LLVTSIIKFERYIPDACTDRCRGLCKGLVKFFFVLGRVADENTFDTYWVCRMDETALLTIRKPSNILSRSGKC